ncbi:hypothetical protein V8J88_14990 [Massilia sp. W12]|uniref:hypothetical protein n=1 Tax=Massilia sp. W12 TaxID=3126507 RepID=UPI0030D5450C
MPVQNFIAALRNRTIQGMGARPGNLASMQNSELSGTCFVTYYYYYVTVSASATNRLACAISDQGEANGVYLQYKDYASTIAKISGLQPVMVSGGFSGCRYKIFSHNGQYYCAHISRPSDGANTEGAREACVNLMDNYATQKGWTELQSIGTTGYIGQNGCAEVVVVSQLFDDRIDTLVLQVDNRGMIVGDALTSTAL